MDEFIDEPKPRGFDTKKILLIVIPILIIGIIVSLYLIFKPSDVTLDASQSGAKNNNQTNGSLIKQNDDLDSDLRDILEKKKKDDNKVSIINEQVPPIEAIKKISSATSTNVQSVASNNQLEQIKEQERIKKEQNRYEAFNSKSIMYTSQTNKSSETNNKSVTENKESYIKTSSNNSQPSQTNIKPPVSKYVLNAGTLIPSVMISGLNSQISGNIIALVRENVYDSSTGNNLLIPQGSRLFGKYDNNIAYGDQRIAVAWTKIYYPDGKSVDLSGMPGSDLEGYTGFTDQVDNHYWKLFGTSFIMGVITGAMQYSQNNTNSNAQIGGYSQPTVGQTMSGSLGQQLGQTGLAITQKGLNVAPTIIIRQGYTFNIMITADLNLM